MKMTASGGIGAAHGFFYQYLRTAEAAFHHLHAAEGRVVVVESDNPDERIVDYSIRDADGRRLLLVQVKSTAAERHLGLSDALPMLQELVAIDSESYLIETNRKLTSATEELAQLLATDRDALDDTAWRTAITELTAGPNTLEPTSNTQWTRLRRCRITHDTRPAHQVQSDIAQHISDLRRGEHLAVSTESSALLAGNVVTAIFERGTRTEDRTIDADALSRIVKVDDITLSGALGRFDSGIPLTQCPPPPAVHRPDLVETVLERLESAWNQQTVVRCVLRGLSGIGKSAVAAAVAHASAHAYDRLIWVDAEHVSTLRAQFTQLIDHLDPSASIDQLSDWTDSRLQDKATQLIASSACRWLFIFDNAPSVHEITAWVPSRGRIAVLATSTQHGGWGAWRPVDIGPMTNNQAQALVYARLGIKKPNYDQRDRAERLCQELELWPLAIDLACAFLNNSGRGLALSDDYILRIAQVLATNDRLRAEGYPRSLNRPGESGDLVV